MQNLVISNEKINDSQICPTLFHYKHNLRQTPVKKANYLEAGEMIHEILRQYYQDKIDKLNSPWHKFLDLGRNYAAKKLTLKAEEVEEVIRDASMYFEYYHSGNESWEILGAEEPFAKELWTEGDIRIIVTGKIDLRVKTNHGKGPLAIVDHKYEARFNEKQERDNQAICYSWAFETRDFIYNRIGKQKTKKIEEKLLRPYLSYSDYQIKDWKDSAIETALDIIRYTKAEKFPMRFTGCQFQGYKCTFYDVCNTTPDNRDYKLRMAFKDRESGHSLMENK